MFFKELWKIKWIVQVRTFGTRCGYMYETYYSWNVFLNWMFSKNKFIDLDRVKYYWNRLETNYSLNINWKLAWLIMICSIRLCIGHMPWSCVMVIRLHKFYVERLKFLNYFEILSYANEFVRILNLYTIFSELYDFWLYDNTSTNKKVVSILIYI